MMDSQQKNVTLKDIHSFACYIYGETLCFFGYERLQETSWFCLMLLQDTSTGARGKLL